VSQLQFEPGPSRTESRYINATAKYLLLLSLNINTISMLPFTLYVYTFTLYVYVTDF
jgi:hypothetical protein